MEIIDLSGQNRTCNAVPDYPYNVTDHAMATVDSFTVACGGHTYINSQKCWIYAPRQNKWVCFPPLKEERELSRSLQLSSGSFLVAGSYTKYHLFIVKLFHLKHWFEGNILNVVSYCNIVKSKLWLEWEDEFGNFAKGVD